MPCSIGPAIDADAVDDVILGAANQAGEDNRNVGRMAALLAGMPVEVPGPTVNRLCGSGMHAIIDAAHAIVAGDGAVFVAGGVESMTRAPFVMAKPSAAFPRGEQTLYDTTLGWRFTNPRLAMPTTRTRWARRRRTSSSAAASRARSRTHSRSVAPPLGGRRTRRAASRTRSCRSTRRRPKGDDG